MGEVDVEGQEVFDGRPALAFRRARDRRRFLAWAAALGVGASLAGGSGRRLATAQSGGGDVGILNYALALEYLESDFFARGLRADLVDGRARELIEPIARHEDEHVSILTTTITDLGGQPVERPRFTYPGGTFDDARAWLRTGASLQDLAVKAYHGQVTRISNRELLGAAASLAGTESRHAAIMAELAGRNPFPAPIEVAKGRSFVLRAARPFLRSS
jgi:rubrerythrin